MRGYKGFEPDMTCRGFQYEVGQTYEMDGEVEPCERGFHFCPQMADVFNYYDEKGCRYAEVEAVGKVVEYGDKSVTNKIRIIRELTGTEVMEAMYAQEGLGFKDDPFPAKEIVQARDAGILGEILPSGTEFPVTFANGERNVLVVGRDKNHTYLVTKYIMAETIAMNDDWTNEGGWPACRMREHVQGIYNMLPEDIRKVIVPMHIRQFVQDEVVECEDRAFLLSAVNVFGRHSWKAEKDCGDALIDIFADHRNRLKFPAGGDYPSSWGLRTVLSDRHHAIVNENGIQWDSYANKPQDLVFAICIEKR